VFLERGGDTFHSSITDSQNLFALPPQYPPAGNKGLGREEEGGLRGREGEGEGEGEEEGQVEGR
jgi:hypothetical protein